MHDGVSLAADIHLPAQGVDRIPAPCPVLLLRTPYDKSGHAGTGAFYARRGYIFVAQDVRGRYASEGTFFPFADEAEDGADTMAWIRAQPWCNGRIGTMGGSALGITQNLMAPTRPPGLRAQYIQVAAASLYHHAAYVGGAKRKSQVEGWIRGNRFSPKALALFNQHPNYDAYWQGFDAAARADQIDTPAVHVGGWFDTFSLGTVEAFRTRQTLGRAGAKGHQKLVMGPWAHGGFRGGRVGQLTFPHARMPKAYDALRWFDAWLKGDGSAMKKVPAVAYYVMGDTTRGAKAPGNEWRYAAAWPPPSTPAAYYFHADGALSPQPPPHTDGKPAARTWTFDPDRPCPTIGGCNLNLPKGPCDQRQAERRDDVLTFSTPPLAEPVEATGHARAVLHVASSAVDTDLSVRLCDVYPDGRSYLMAEGMLRLRYRNGLAKPVPLTPGKRCEVTVELWPTSIVFAKGHRIRVSVTSSNYPRFDVNPGTGRPYAPGKPVVKQANTIFCDGATASRLILPVVTASGTSR